MMDNVLSFGKGARPLVIIPGLSMTKVTDGAPLLEALCKPFTDGWTVHVIDRPDIIPEGTTNASLSEEYVSAMTALGINDADIIGVSQGGMIAQHIAVKHPEMVHKAVLAATLSRPNAVAGSVFRKWLDLAAAQDWYSLNMDMFGRMYSDAYLEKNGSAIDTAARFFKPDDPRRFIRLLKACMTCGPEEGLGAVRCRVLVVGAEDDPILTGRASYEIASSLGCEIHMFRGFRHAFYDEASAEFYGLVRRWLQK